MPQMAPMNWLLLYFIFSFSYIFIVIINYYMFLYTPKFPNKIKFHKKINWKW